jgi:hypothetical protein
MSRNFALISAPSAKNVSGYSGIRQECCRIGWCDGGAQIGPSGARARSEALLLCAQTLVELLHAKIPLTLSRTFWLRDGFK